MAAFLQYLLLLMPLAVFAQYGAGGAFDSINGNGMSIDYGGGEPVEPGTRRDGMGTGGGQGNGGMGTGGMGGGGGAGAGVPAPDYPVGASSNNFDIYGPSILTGNSAAGNGASQMDDDSEEGSGSSELGYGGSEGGAWLGGGGGLGLLKSPGSRWTVTILSCLLAVAVIALIAFFIIKRKRSSGGAVAEP